MSLLRGLLAFLSAGPRHKCHFHQEGEPWLAASRWCALAKQRMSNGRCCICGATAVGKEIATGKGIYGVWEPAG